MSLWSTLAKVAGIAAAPFTGGASLIPAIIGAGADIAGGLINHSATNKATEQQQNSIAGAEGSLNSYSNAAINENHTSLDEIRQNNMPSTIVGNEGLFSLQEMMRQPQDPDAIRQETLKDPGFQFNFDNGLKAINRAAANSGGIRSGQFYKDITKFAEDYTSKEYGNASDRLRQQQTDRFNRLMGITAIGENAKNSTNAATQNSANNVTDIYNQTGRQMVDLQTGSGNVAAAGTVQNANNLTSTIGNVAGDVAELIKLREMRKQNQNQSGYSDSYQSPEFNRSM